MDKYLEGEQGQLYWTCIETRGTFLGAGEFVIFFFLLLGVNIQGHVRANSERQYKGDKVTIGRIEVGLHISKGKI